MSDMIDRQAAIDLIESIETERLKGNVELIYAPAIKGLRALPSAQPDSKETSSTHKALDTISRQAAIDAMKDVLLDEELSYAIPTLEKLPSAQPEIIRCRNCVYGEQDADGVWFCRSLGCQIGDIYGNGFCADAERRTDE